MPRNPLAAAVIRNPRSQRHRTARGGDVDVPEGLWIESPLTREALHAALAGFAAEGVRHLLVDGGDGTLREVMSALPTHFGGQLPVLSLRASGNTNLAAWNVGHIPRGPRAVAQWVRMLRGERPTRASVHRPLRVRWPDGSRPPVLGFFAGAANYPRAVAMANDSLRVKGLLHGWAVSATLAGAAWRVLAGGRDNIWQRGTPLSLAVDDAPAREGARFVVLVTALPQLLMGLWPFWSSPVEAGPLRWLDIDAPAPKFGRALPFLLRGAPRPWMHASGAYRSGRAEVLRLQLDETLIIDGEPFAPDAGGQLLLDAGPAFTFHAPA